MARSSTIKRAVYGAGSLILFALVTQQACAQAVWVQRYPSTAPSARERTVMAYDPVRSRSVLFGGQLDNNYLGDTWEWDGGGWIDRSPTTAPPRRVGAAMAYSGTGILMFGGNTQGSGNTLLSDVWEWDGSQWIPRAPGPPARSGAAMAYDAERDRVVLFGGQAVSVSQGAVDLDDTWEWDGNIWTRLQPSIRPPAGNTAMAYDSTRQKTVLFARTAAQTWEWDGQDWKQRFPSQSPGFFSHITMAFHAEIGKTVLLATIRERSETWEWDGNNWRWNVLAPIHSNPSPASAYDSERQRTVLFGGLLEAETWEYVAGPPASFSNFGFGCAGSGGTPELRPVPGQVPKLGHAYGMQMNKLPTDPMSPVFVVVGFSNASLTSAPDVTLPAALDALGLAGCSLFVSDDVTFPVQKFGNTATWSVQIPDDPTLAGLIVYFQGIALDPIGVNWATLSDAGEVVLGNH